MDELTPRQQAAAFHGIATNEAFSLADRLGCALQALEFYEAEIERLDPDPELRRGVQGGDT